MERKTAGFREIEHTADWELHVWAPDMVTLLEMAAQGMYELSHTHLSDAQQVDRSITIPFTDRETLLVDFLSELLFYAEDENLAFDDFQLKFDGTELKAQISGASIANQAKEIKAVTYHRMAVCEIENGLEVNIVFDV
ncbi:MAG: archease [Anaerolineales bacterium]|nr:archease [Chloroflexota bacterium]MBL6979624.1 archease [Anaerolineales bacterium]